LQQEGWESTGAPGDDPCGDIEHSDPDPYVIESFVDEYEPSEDDALGIDPASIRQAETDLMIPDIIPDVDKLSDADVALWGIPDPVEEAIP
jgi:hypothetical protein